MMLEGSRRAQAPLQVLFKCLYVSCLPAPQCPVLVTWVTPGWKEEATKKGSGYRKGKKWYLFCSCHKPSVIVQGFKMREDNFI